MALYYNTNDLNLEEVRIRTAKCKSQNEKVYEIAKQIKYIWRWKLYELYKEVYGIELQDSVASRALSTLLAQRYLIDTGDKIQGIKGAPNNVYMVNPNPPKEPVSVPQKLSIGLSFIHNPDGTQELNKSEMLKEFEIKYKEANRIIKSL